MQSTEQNVRYSNFHVDYLVDETLREGLERCPLAVDEDSKYQLVQAMVDAGLREFVIGCGPEEPELARRCLKSKLENGTLSKDSKFVFIILLNCWEAAYENFKNLPREYIEDLTFSFGMIEFHEKDQLFERVVNKFVDLGAKSLKASVLNNFSKDVDEDKYLRITSQIERIKLLGIPTIRINDSLGLLQPETTAFLSRKLVNEHPGITFCLHAHNDRGLGFANALASIYNGFKMIEGSLAGFGNRSGLPAIEWIDKVCKERKIKLGHTPIDSEKLVKAAQMAEKVFMAVPNVYRPVSGIFVEQVNFGVLNIPDFLEVEGKRDYFVNYVGLHPKTIKKALKSHNFSPETVENPAFINQVLEFLSNYLKEISWQKRNEYNELLSSIDKFYSSASLSSKDIRLAAEACINNFSA